MCQATVSEEQLLEMKGTRASSILSNLKIVMETGNTVHGRTNSDISKV